MLESSSSCPASNVLPKLEEFVRKGEHRRNTHFMMYLVNNVFPKLEQFDESSRRNTHFLRSMYIYIAVGHATNFSFGFIPRKTTALEQISLTPISETGYILNINGAFNREEIFEHWKRGVNNVLNLNTGWTIRNILSYIEHSFS